MDLFEKDLFGVPSSREHFNKELLEDLTVVLMKHTPSSLKDTEKYLEKAWSNLKAVIESELIDWKLPKEITVIDRVELKNFAKIYMPKSLKNGIEIGYPWTEVVNDVTFGWYAEFYLPKKKKLKLSDSESESESESDLK